jgi:hypothetical protein
MPLLDDEGKIDSISSEVSHNFCFCFTLLSLLIVWTVSRIESTYLNLDLHEDPKVPHPTHHTVEKGDKTECKRISAQL